MPPTIRIDIELPGDSRLVLSGIYRKGQSQLGLQIGQAQQPRVRFVDPRIKVESLEPRRRDTLELAPHTLMLVKVNK